MAIGLASAEGRQLGVQQLEGAVGGAGEALGDRLDWRPVEAVAPRLASRVRAGRSGLDPWSQGYVADMGIAVGAGSAYAYSVQDAGTSRPSDLYLARGA